MTGEEISKLKEELEQELKRSEKELTELNQSKGVTKKFALDFQTRLQTLLLLERDIHIRDVIVNIAQHKVSRISEVKSENSHEELQRGSAAASFSVAPLKASSLRDSTDMAEIAINVLCSAATNQIMSECQNTIEPRDHIATSSDEPTPNVKHNPNSVIQLPAQLYDWYVLFKEKVSCTPRDNAYTFVF